MKNLKYLTISILPLMWSVYFLFEILTGRVKDLPTIIGNIALIILSALVGFYFYKLSQKYPQGFKCKTIIIIFSILMVIDQGIKLIIKFFFFEDYIDIIKGFLSFNPIINTDGSWLNARFSTGISFPLLIFVNFIAIVLFFELYRYYLSKGNNSFYGDMCFLFIFSGSLCSLIDKIFYGGSLDFIGISNLYIADIKDIYINLGILFFIISIVISGYLTEDDNTSFKEDLASIKKFLIFSKNDILSLFKNN